MMFVDAAAIVAVLGNEQEGKRCAAAIRAESSAFTSSLAVWEAAVALARADRLNLSVEECFEIVSQFLEQSGISVRQLPPPDEAAALSLDAARRFRSGRGRLNLADCFHYACAKHYAARMLSTADEFRFTDLDVIA